MQVCMVWFMTLQIFDQRCLIHTDIAYFRFYIEHFSLKHHGNSKFTKNIKTCFPEFLWRHILKIKILSIYWYKKESSNKILILTQTIYIAIYHKQVLNYVV